MKTLTILISASVLALGLPGCTLMTAGVKKGDERNFARSLNDISAGRAIKARMSRAEGFRLGGVDVEVAEGIVVLTGNVPEDTDREEAERIAWSAPNIIKVGNEIAIKQGKGLVRSAKDTVLHETIQARFVATKPVKARNFNVEVHDGTVYLLGVARTPEELEMAANIAASTKGTKRVVSYVKVHGDHQTASAYGPGYHGVPSQPYTQSQTAEITPYSAPVTGPITGPIAKSMPSAPQTAPLTAPQTAPLADSLAAPSPLPVAPLPVAPQLGKGTDLPAIPDENGTVADNQTVTDPDAIESGEPYYRDPVTGERIILPPGVKPIPYVPDQGPGSLGHGGAPLPPGAKPSKTLGDGESYIVDPKTGNMVPVFYQK